MQWMEGKRVTDLEFLEKNQIDDYKISNVLIRSVSRPASSGREISCRSTPR